MPITLNGTTGVVTPGATIGSINGILKSSSGVVSQAVSGTDFSSGIQGAKAWVNFDGTTSPGTIRSSYNVSSITKNATGDYTVNFATPMADANYALFVTPQSNSTTANAVYTVSYNVNSARIVYVQTGVGNIDQPQAGVAIFGN